MRISPALRYMMNDEGEVPIVHENLQPDWNSIQFREAITELVELVEEFLDARIREN